MRHRANGNPFISSRIGAILCSLPCLLFLIEYLRPIHPTLRLTLRAAPQKTPVFIGALRVYGLQPLRAPLPVSSRFKVQGSR